ncbi:DUF2848 domain-containing protein [Corynebacterium heidelbergense]|uniref:DUF2848 domain-containing protein n=1 Tax=Corynebacterium heidelbergense TaxID=2055947 RepID=A0A364V5I0_9CORY|nr:DUF2848 domain-containing protein [Corynebacterium heidelbergense]RAV31895.1 DUF2848 domain-containing protein [Corynebacterium heidelbergense]
MTAENPRLTFQLPDGAEATVTVARLLNAGYAGQDQEEVRAHIRELAELGVPAPSTTPTLYPVPPYLAQQCSNVNVQHGKTSGEAEWALIIDDDGRELLTVACDHTDRSLEVHGVAWSKNASPDVLGRKAWLLSDIADHVGEVWLRAWVGESDELIQEAPVNALLSPDYWLEVLQRRGERIPGTVLLSGTVVMKAGVDQFANRWKVALTSPKLGTISHEYTVTTMATPIE